MREIKFRAWDNGQMEYSGSMPDFGFWKWAGYSSNTKLMQYTGLKDKNGKEIYEGDILRIEYHDDEAPDVYIGAVEFAEGWYGMSVVATSKHPAHFAPFSEQARPEIIGNIYENPNLLKQLALV